jgi:hypothetical protein
MDDTDIGTQDTAADTANHRTSNTADRGTASNNMGLLRSTCLPLYPQSSFQIERGRYNTH